ncbi:MAG: hypothetical protein LBI20_00430 [Holosporales bacterium]|nr:hypothetical protein [Holosporales bacterium]
MFLNFLCSILIKYGKFNQISYTSPILSRYFCIISRFAMEIDVLVTFLLQCTLIV